MSALSSQTVGWGLELTLTPSPQDDQGHSCTFIGAPFSSEGGMSLEEARGCLARFVLSWVEARNSNGEPISSGKTITFTSLLRDSSTTPAHESLFLTPNQVDGGWNLTLSPGSVGSGSQQISSQARSLNLCVTPFVLARPIEATPTRLD